MIKTITFNGITKPYLYLLRDGERPAWAPIENQIIDVPGRPGGYISESNVQVRRLNLAVGVKVPIGMTLETVKEDMAAWLITDKVAELFISDEPNRIYFAKIEGTFDPENLVRFGIGILTFICPEPYKYGPERTLDITTNPIIDVQGTADTYPIVEVELKKDTPFVSIGNGDDINMIGQIPDAEEPVYEKFQNILTDKLLSTVGWTKVNFTPFTGSITNGTIVADTQGFVPSNYGYVSGMEWYGPALTKSLGQTLQDFHLHLTAFQRATDQGSFGRVEAYALDSTSKPVCSVHFIKDFYGKITRPEIILYDANGVAKKILSFKGSQVQDWTDLYGYLSIMREGQRFIAQAERSRGLFGGVLDRRVELFHDVQNKYQRPIVSVSIAFQAYRTNPTLNRNRAARLSVDKINQQQGVPYIGKAGDIITFNHLEDIILKNGIDIKNEKAFIGKYFALKPGENVIIAEPEDAIERVTVRWPDRWR